MRVLGLMSGTSVDGIDAALVHFIPNTGESGGVLQLRVEHHDVFPCPDDLRSRLLAAVTPAQVGVAEPDRHVSGTPQIGEPAWIAATGIPVVSNLRDADIADGEQGAPLVFVAAEAQGCR